MGEILAEGSEAAAFLERALTRGLADLAVGRMRYALMCNDAGGIEEDLTVYRLAADSFLLVVNAATTDADMVRLTGYRRQWGMQVELLDASSGTGKLDIQGPRAFDIAGRVLGGWLAGMRRFEFREHEWMLASRSGYAGEDGLELYLPANMTEAVWQALLEAGKPHGMLACGLGARYAQAGSLPAAFGR